MTILIGYSMRSGSTLLQHILDQHSQIQSYSDLSSIPAIARILAGSAGPSHACVKPMDLVYLWDGERLARRFDKRIWLARDPRDSYLSARKSGYAYLAWPPGRRVAGIDVGLLHRWKRIYRRYFENEASWHLVRYEDLVTDPDATLQRLFGYLEISPEQLLPFEPFRMAKGGDYKIRRTRTVQAKSVGRHREELTAQQQAVFAERLGAEMAALGYTEPTAEPTL